MAPIGTPEALAFHLEWLEEENLPKTHPLEFGAWKHHFLIIEWINDRTIDGLRTLNNDNTMNFEIWLSHDDVLTNMVMVLYYPFWSSSYIYI